MPLQRGAGSDITLEEALLVTQTPLPTILAGSTVYPFTGLARRTCVYLAWGALFAFAPRPAPLGRSLVNPPGLN